MRIFSDGCLCLPGYHGDSCNKQCPAGWYGDQCKQQCQCENEATCDSVDGSCDCVPGYTGRLCQNSKSGFPQALEIMENHKKFPRHIYPSLVLVQPRKTRPCLTERLLMGRKESNQTKTKKFHARHFIILPKSVKN